MARIRWTPPAGWVAETGARLSFRAPCDCVTADELLIKGKLYTFRSAMGTQVSELGDAFVEGALVEAVLDCENGTAYIVNADGTTGLKTWKAETEDALDDMEARITGAEERLGDIDSLEERMDDFDLAVAALKVTADDLGAQVAAHTEWQGTIDESVADLYQKADDTEARFETITTWQDGMEQSLADVEQVASDQAASITSLTTWKDDLRIGAANLIPNSKGDTLEGWSIRSSSQVSILEDDEKGSCISLFGISTSVYVYASTPRTPRLEPGETYMLSLDVYATSTAVGDVSIFWAYDTDEDPATDDNPTYYHERVPLHSGALDTSGAWHRLTIPFTTSDDVRTGYVYIGAKRAEGSSSAGYLRTANIQLERGPFATDWKPYNEDVATAASLAKIEQIANANSASIGLLVENGEASGGLIIEAINGEGVTATIKADRVDIGGALVIDKINKYIEATTDYVKINAEAVDIGGALIIEKINGLADETEEGETLVKISADLVDIEGKVNAEYIEALGITATSLKVRDTDGATIFAAGGNACTVGGLTTTADGLVANKALHADRDFRATLTCTSTGTINDVTVSSWGSGRYNHVYEVPVSVSKLRVSGWSSGDRLFMVDADNIPTGNGSGYESYYYKALSSSDGDIFEVDVPTQAQIVTLYLIVSSTSSTEREVSYYDLRFSSDGILGGTAADGGQSGGFVKLTGTTLDIGWGHPDEGDEGLRFSVDAGGVQVAHIPAPQYFSFPAKEMHDFDAGESATCSTLEELLSLICANFQHIKDDIQALENNQGGSTGGGSTTI